MILPDVYRAVLCSRIPNNHCELCSYFSPEWNNSNDPRGFYHENEMTGMSPNVEPIWDKEAPSFDYKTVYAISGGFTHCPSCNRLCVMCFLPEGAELPERVPDSWDTRPQFNTLEAMNKIVPKQPRGNWHDNYWNDLEFPWYVIGSSQDREAAKNYRGKRALLLSNPKRVNKPEPEIDFENMEAKPSRFKVKLVN